MLKKILLMAVLCSGQPFLYAQTSDALEQVAPLAVIYLRSDSTQTIANWKLDKKESVDIASLIAMQLDVFGAVTEPEEYSIKESYDVLEKTRTVEYTLHDVFEDCPSAQLTCTFFKGKKKKDRYQFTEISIKSDEKPNNSFVDSLCAPYLQMLARGAIDSLIRDALNYDEIMESIEQLEDHKEEATEFATKSFEMVRNFLTPDLERIDPSQPISFGSCTLQASTKKTNLEVKLNCKTIEDASTIRLNLTFLWREGQYDLVALGTGSGPEMNFE